jgi:hypothetical protein
MAVVNLRMTFISEMDGWIAGRAGRTSTDFTALTIRSLGERGLARSPCPPRF